MKTIASALSATSFAVPASAAGVTDRKPSPCWHPRALLRAVLGRLARWNEVSRGRRALGRMPMHLLDDIGVTPGQAAREAGRPFWDQPRY